MQAFPLSDVQAYMGHADIPTTMVYVHHTPQHAAADRLGQLVERPRTSGDARPSGSGAIKPAVAEPFTCRAGSSAGLSTIARVSLGEWQIVVTVIGIFVAPILAAKLAVRTSSKSSAITPNWMSCAAYSTRPQRRSPSASAQSRSPSSPCYMTATIRRESSTRSIPLSSRFSGALAAWRSASRMTQPPVRCMRS